MELKHVLKDYQVETVEYMLQNPYCIVALVMGLGKSATAIATKMSIENSRCLVICPAYLVLNWKNEINKFAKNQVITVFKKHADVFFPVDSDFVICSYDIAVKSEILFEWANMIVIDEAHALKNMNSKRSKEIHRKVFENSIERLYLLTGTPIKNRVEEFYSLIALCNYNPRIKESAFLKKV